MLNLVLLVFSFVCAVLAAFGVSTPPWLNLLAVSFAFFIASLIFGQVHV